jgi:hypothetical protein
MWLAMNHYLIKLSRSFNKQSMIILWLADVYWISHVTKFNYKNTSNRMADRMIMRLRNKVVATTASSMLLSYTYYICSIKWIKKFKISFFWLLFFKDFKIVYNKIYFKYFELIILYFVIFLKLKVAAHHSRTLPIFFSKFYR